MKVLKQFFLSLLAVVFGWSNPVRAAAPPNDDFANAMEIPSLLDAVSTVESTTVMATHEVGEPSHFTGTGVGSVWFRWLAPWNGDIMFATTGSRTGTVVAVYAGSVLTNLVPLAAGKSAVPRVTQGERYYIAADAPLVSQGTARILVYPPPSNNNFADASLLTGTSGTFLGTNYSADAEPDEPAWWLDGTSASIWWRWTAPVAGHFWFTTSNSVGLTVLSAVYTGNAVSNLTTVTGPWVTSPGNDLTFFARSNWTYYLRFSGYSTAPRGTIAGRFQFTPFVIPTNGPANDYFVNRQALTELTNLAQADNSAGTSEPEEPFPPSCNPAQRSLWWSFTPPADGWLNVSAGGVSNAVVTTVYRGQEIYALEQLAYHCTQPLWLPVQAGVEYPIQVDGAFSKAGSLILAVDFHPVPENDDFANSLHLEGTNVTVSGNTVAASTEANEPRLEEGVTSTLWYSWAAPVSGRVWFISTTVGFAIYTGPTIERLERVPVISNTGGAYAFSALEGTVYHIQIDGADGGPRSFSFELRVEPPHPPVNDHFRDAIRFFGYTGNDLRSLIGATREPGEPLHFGTPSFKSLWWYWQPPYSGAASIQTHRSLAANVGVVVYVGDELSSLTLVARGTNAAGFAAEGGTVYRIAAVVPDDVGADVVVDFGIGNSSGSRLVPGNLLREPSFEDTGLGFAYWHVVGSFGGFVNTPGGADGSTWLYLTPGAQLWQEFATVPGRRYDVQFAFRNTMRVRVKWDGEILGDGVAAAGEEWLWQWPKFTAIASASTSRLTFECLGGNTEIDGVSVVWPSEPPSIVTPPVSSSAIAGGSAAFLVGARGAPPLFYQWHRGDQLLAGQTNNSLLLESVAPSAAGSYSVVVSNAFGVVASSPVTLTVEAPTDPVIVLQPYGDKVAEGGYFVLGVAAIGSPPLAYQWFRDDQVVPDATNSHLPFNSFESTNAGSYSVRISNAAGSVWSLPATLTLVPPVAGGGTIYVVNRFASGFGIVEAPVHDVDGVTRLNGSNFVAQLYTGLLVESLRPVGEPVQFRTGFAAGFIPTRTVQIPNVPPQSPVLCQLKAWEAGKGATYEEARALGGRFGASLVLSVMTGGGLAPPGDLSGLQSFNLRAGMPLFNVGVIELQERFPNGSIRWSLRGEPGFRYLVERATNNFTWHPLFVLTNASGVVAFTDAGPVPSSGAFYRSRIVD